ncbi:MAG: hypothetical protein A2664_02850 [Candidatus Taylorbacteria bacterium RIFCSPHIGHO2_01_FULL_46_22b]|uniref:Sphingomyelin synthase-like domain-containing protein n=1 Tax=Candidatus Taylorbacteria bacterium RIFCSPHIGHO2_01_FULL_46_22b TaxID=1802301 RepID=A0A1G2M669_9BACT|nr:MAG: hypothetical protein A2664_02850 [Candidatus Taylorbacteria bacterium RIFCSPHIGHO2_01_FULL_46_22b]
MLQKWIRENSLYVKDKKFVWTTILSIALLLVSFVINYYAGTYATRRESSPVTDLILSNIPVFDLDGIFVYGAIALWIFVCFVCVWDIKKIPFTLHSISLFIIIRAGFINLTHIGQFPTRVEIESDLIQKFTFGGDLFFSGHTGLPFLMALIFWRQVKLRIIFLASSIVFGAVVLMTHLHYSIDVFSAFFITYSIFHLAEWIFKKERAWFLEKSPKQLS